MALTEPIDILSDFPGWVTEFEPVFRQEQSRVAAGRTYVKDLGPPLWTLTAQSRVLRPNLLDHWRARLQALENGLVTFVGYSLSRCYPIRYPNGSWGMGFDGETATLYEVGEDRKSVRVADLPVGFRLSVGDLIQIGDADLHRVMEEAVAGETGITSEFEVRPHVWPGVDGGESPPLAVKVKRPACVMAIVPGSVSAQANLSGYGTISFRGIEAR